MGNVENPIELTPPIPLTTPLWARHSHVQTVLGYFLRFHDSPGDFESWDIPTTGNDTLRGHYYAGTKPVAISLFHGLGGCSQSSYMERMTLHCQSKGYHVLLVNHRGCGPGIGLATGPYHSGRGEDIGAAVEYYRRKLPDAKHISIGYSLSGNALLLLMSGARGNTPPDGAITVNAPVDLSAASTRLGKGFNRIYDRHFVKLCKEGVSQRERLGLITSVQFPYRMTLSDFDEQYTAPASGFRGRQHYYEECSAWPHLHNIRQPTVMITSEDDPFVPIELYRSASPSNSCVLHIEPKGGHMGYLSQSKISPEFGHRWMDYAISHYLKLILKTLD